MPTLLEIVSEAQALDSLLEELNGDLSDARVDAAVTGWIAEIEANLSEKIDGYATFIRELECRAEARRAESKRIARCAASDENTADYLRTRLKAAMEAMHIRKAIGQVRQVSIAKNGGVLPMEVDDVRADDLDPKYTIRAICTPAIREDLENGITLPFARLRERGEHLNIK